MQTGWKLLPGLFLWLGLGENRAVSRGGDAQPAGCPQSSPGTGFVPPWNSPAKGPCSNPSAPYGNQPPLSPQRQNQRCSVRAFFVRFFFFFLPTLEPKVAAFSSFLSFLCCCGRVVVTQAAVTLKK